VRKAYTVSDGKLLLTLTPAEEGGFVVTSPLDPETVRAQCGARQASRGRRGCSVLHGHLRATADLDLIVQLTSENARDAVRALESLGFQPTAPVPALMFADAEARRTWIEDKGMTVFGLWSDRFPGLEVDLFASEPLDFEAAYARAVRVQLSSTVATVVALEDLVALKKAAGRPVDLADIEALRMLAEEHG
jgi:hypothetical protein